MIDICDMGAASLDPQTNALLAQCKGAPLSEDDSDATDYGAAPLMCALGVTAVPYPRTPEGAAEGLVVTDVPGVDGVVIGARDTRTAGIVGNLKPGDTAVHSTGPQQAAQLLLKEEKRQAVLATKGTDGKQLLLLLDGNADKATLAAFGAVFEISKEQGIVMADATGKAGIQIKDGVVSIFGTQVVLGGRTPALPVLAGTPPGAPVPGVFIGS